MSYIFGAERQKCIKRVKNAKNVLDKCENTCYNIASRPFGCTHIKKPQKNIKKSEKTFKKGIDKVIWMWYNIKVAARVATSVIEN